MSVDSFLSLQLLHEQLVAREGFQKQFLESLKVARHTVVATVMFFVDDNRTLLVG